MFVTAVFKTNTFFLQHSALHTSARWPLLEKLSDYLEKQQHTLRVGSTSYLQLLPYGKEDNVFWLFGFFSHFIFVDPTFWDVHGPFS